MISTIDVGASKFLGMRRIFAQIYPNLPEKFWATACKFFPSKIMKTFFGMTSKKSLHVFFCKNTILWAPLYEIKQDWEPFFHEFQRFCPDFQRFCPDFQ